MVKMKRSNKPKGKELHYLYLLFKINKIKFILFRTLFVGFIKNLMSKKNFL